MQSQYACFSYDKCEYEWPYNPYQVFGSVGCPTEGMCKYRIKICACDIFLKNYVNQTGYMFIGIFSQRETYLPNFIDVLLVVGGHGSSSAEYVDLGPVDENDPSPMTCEAPRKFDNAMQC